MKFDGIRLGVVKRAIEGDHEDRGVEVLKDSDIARDISGKSLQTLISLLLKENSVLVDSIAEETAKRRDANDIG